MGNLLINFAVKHQDYVIGMVSGAAISHIPLLIHVLICNPFVSGWIKKYPKTVDAIVDSLQSEVHQVADAPVQPVEPPKA